MPTDEETLKKDEFLIKLMEHYYEEDERRNELIDSKNSQMIVLTGAMLSLQTTLFTNLFITKILENKSILICWKGISALIMGGAFVSLMISMGLFIWAYAFQDSYFMVPDPKSILKFNKHCKYNKSIIINRLLKSFDGAIDCNEELMASKVRKGKWGFRFLILGGIFTLVFVILIVVLLYILT